MRIGFLGKVKVISRNGREGLASLCLVFIAPVSTTTLYSSRVEGGAVCQYKGGLLHAYFVLELSRIY